MKAASQLWEKFVYNFLPFCPVSFWFRERGDRGREGQQVDRQSGSCGRGHRVFKCLFQVQRATEPGGMRLNGGRVGEKTLCGDV